MTSCIHKMCGRTYGQTNMKRAIIFQKSTIREIGIICTCSDHGQSRYQIWIKCDKREMTSVWQYICPHILCTQLVICLLSHFIHIWYLGWPWSEHAHIIPISRMVDFCESYNPFHVCLTIRPFAHLEMTSCVHKMCKRTYGQTNMKRAITLAQINHPWNRYNMRMLRSWPIPFHVCLTIRPSAHLVYATSHLSFVAFYSYLVSWLAMIWAHMLRSWSTKIPNMNKMWQKTND
jgi:hypothetical protein